MLTKRFQKTVLAGCVVAGAADELPQESSLDGGGVGLLLHWRLPKSGGWIPVLATARLGTPAHQALWKLLPGAVVDLHGEADLIEALPALPTTAVMRVHAVEAPQPAGRRKAKQ